MIKKLRFGYGKESLTSREGDNIVKQMLLALSVAINQTDISEIKGTLIDIKVYLEDHLLCHISEEIEETIERPFPERDFVKGLTLKDGKVDFHYLEACLKDALKKIERMKPSGFIVKRSKELGIEPSKQLIKGNKEQVKKNQQYLREEVEEDLKMLKKLRRLASHSVPLET